MTIKFYGHPMSTCSRKVLTALAEKKADFEFHHVELMKGEHKQPEHLARQPFGDAGRLAGAVSRARHGRR